MKNKINNQLPKLVEWPFSNGLSLSAFVSLSSLICFFNSLISKTVYVTINTAAATNQGNNELVILNKFILINSLANPEIIEIAIGVPIFFILLVGFLVETNVAKKRGCLKIISLN